MGMKPPRGFTKAPTLEELRPTPAERHALELLWEWQERSKRSAVVLGIAPCAFLRAQVRGKK